MKNCGDSLLGDIFIILDEELDFLRSAADLYVPPTLIESDGIESGQSIDANRNLSEEEDQVESTGSNDSS